MSKLSDAIRKHNHHFCTVVVAAAGSSTRMGRDKLVLELGGMPVLARTLLALERCDAVDEIIAVTRSEALETVSAMKERYGLQKLAGVVLGGETRTRSALAGVSEASPRARVICIHDGARPFVSDAVIRDAVHNAVLYKAAAPAIPVKDTIKVAENGVVRQTPERSSLFAVQTPQAFQPELIKAALTKAVQTGISYTDDCAAVEAMGVQVHLSQGSEDNIKITTPADLVLADLILCRAEAEK